MLIQLSALSDGAALATIKVKDERARTIFQNLIAWISRLEEVCSLTSQTHGLSSSGVSKAALVHLSFTQPEGRGE